MNIKEKTTLVQSALDGIYTSKGSSEHIGLGSVLKEMADALGGGGSSDVLSASVTLTHAQVLTLRTNPVQIVSAPGPGLMLVPIQLIGKATFVTIGYSAPGGPPTTTLVYSTSLSSTGFATSVIVTALASIAKASITNSTLVKNEGLSIQQNIGDPSGSTADTIITFTVYYRILPSF